MSEVKLKNPWGFKWDDVSEKEIAKACVMADIPLFIHGEPGIGKSSLARSFDPDIVIVDMSTATYSTIVGKEIANTLNDSIIKIKPSWLSRIEGNDNKNPNHINVLFFDELTNAEIDDQKLTLNIILGRTVNDIWKLPKSTRIVAAGNEVTDSSASHELLETLHSRFAHVFLDIDVNEWLNWAQVESTSNKLELTKINGYKIHPAIYAFIYFNPSKLSTIRYKDGRGMYIIPRGWEMASKLLFQTNNPLYLRCLMDTKTLQEFITFTKINVVSTDSLDSNLENRQTNYVYEAIGLAYQASASNYQKIYDYIKTVYPSNEALDQYKLVYQMKKN